MPKFQGKIEFIKGDKLTDALDKSKYEINQKGYEVIEEDTQQSWPKLGPPGQTYTASKPENPDDASATLFLFVALYEEVPKPHALDNLKTSFDKLVITKGKDQRWELVVQVFNENLQIRTRTTRWVKRGIGAVAVSVLGFLFTNYQQIRERLFPNQFSYGIYADDNLVSSVSIDPSKKTIFRLSGTYPGDPKVVPVEGYTCKWSVARQDSGDSHAINNPSCVLGSDQIFDATQDEAGRFTLSVSALNGSSHALSQPVHPSGKNKDATQDTAITAWKMDLRLTGVSSPAPTIASATQAVNPPVQPQPPVPASSETKPEQVASSTAAPPEPPEPPVSPKPAPSTHAVVAHDAAALRDRFAAKVGAYPAINRRWGSVRLVLYDDPSSRLKSLGVASCTLDASVASATGDALAERDFEADADNQGNSTEDELKWRACENAEDMVLESLSEKS